MLPIRFPLWNGQEWALSLYWDASRGLYPSQLRAHAGQRPIKCGLRAVSIVLLIG